MIADETDAYGIRRDVADGAFGAVSWWAVFGVLCVIGMMRVVAPQFLDRANAMIIKINNKKQNNNRKSQNSHHRSLFLNDY